MDSASEESVTVSTDGAALDRPRLTHIALRVTNLDRSIEWYERFTQLEVLKRMTDDYGRGAWLADRADAAMPFVLSLSEFDPEHDPFAFAPPTVLGPYAHLGFELTSRGAVDEVAAMAEADGALTLSPTDMPPPLGYLCFVEDPDGNTIEFSFAQGTYEIFRTEWGTP
jgi:catechol 2,3-dioxygenase-like lactoylglutathione lyase family enzyme